MKRFLLVALAMVAIVFSSCKQSEERAALTISKVDLTGRTLDEVFATIAPEKIACGNWCAEFPDAPETEFRAFHTGDKLYMRFDVRENLTFARHAVDNGDVWTDSACEFYFSFDGKSYYTVEMNCIGYMLAAYYPEPRKNVIRAGEEILSQVERISTLGREAFGIREGDNSWSLTMVLPTSICHQHDLKSWDGLKITANLYKCGNRPEQPHFISWQPVPTPKPDFHSPQFFKTIVFE